MTILGNYTHKYNVVSTPSNKRISFDIIWCCFVLLVSDKKKSEFNKCRLYTINFSENVATGETEIDKGNNFRLKERFQKTPARGGAVLNPACVKANILPPLPPFLTVVNKTLTTF